MKYIITILFALMLGVAPSNKFNTMCDLDPINGVSYKIVQREFEYYIEGSDGSSQSITFANAVNHCCEYGQGECDFPPQPGYAYSYYTLIKLQYP